MLLLGGLARAKLLPRHYLTSVGAGNRQYMSASRLTALLEFCLNLDCVDNKDIIPGNQSALRSGQEIAPSEPALSTFPSFNHWPPNILNTLTRKIC
jgi:hypothetical protein